MKGLIVQKSNRENKDYGKMQDQISENIESPAEVNYLDPLVAIVILNWNGKKFLSQFLPSVISSTYKHKKIIVADNASTDDSVRFLNENYPDIEIIQNRSNLGFSDGYNTALQKVTADYYVLLNSDVEVVENWIEPIIKLMEQDKRIAACQPKILSYHHKTQFEYAGASGGWIDNFGYPFMRGRVFDDCETDAGQYEDAQPCFWASGASLFIRASAFHEMSGFDTYFFAHQEEIDLCWRLQQAGYLIFVQPASVVYHVGGGTLPRGNSLKTYLNFRNNLIMLYKNLQWPGAIFTILMRLLLDAVAAWKAIFAGDVGYFLAIVKAHLHFIKWILFYQKKSIFPKSKKKHLNGWYNGSIVLDYFIRKKKRFSEIIVNK